MNELEQTVLPPPPPPTVSFSDVERIEALVERLAKEMNVINIRRRFKMNIYKDWCAQIGVIHTELRKIRGAS